MDAHDFPRITRLPPYVSDIVGDLQQTSRRAVLIEDGHRTRQAIRGIRPALAKSPPTKIRRVG